jgi:hypothetical protein
LEWSETWVDRQGHDRTPTIPSHEVSGVVEELGHGVTHVVAGEEVYGLVPFDHDGAAADYVAVRARDLAPKPVTLDHSRTAALPLSALTAWQAFTEQAHVQSGNHVLDDCPAFGNACLDLSGGCGHPNAATGDLGLTAAQMRVDGSGEGPSPIDSSRGSTRPDS